MFKKIILPASGLLMLASLFACPPSTSQDGGTVTDGGNSKSLTREEFLKAAPAAFCAYAERCGFGPILGVSTADCAQEFANLKLPSGTFDGVKANNYIESLKTISCDSDLPYSTNFSAGLVATGGKCTTASDCAEESDCIFGDGGCSGICTPKLKVGETCTSGSRSCVSNTRCAWRTSKKCETRPKGAACNEFYECTGLLRCNIPIGADAGTCQTGVEMAVREGERCDEVCELPLACTASDGGINICTKRPAPGSGCTYGDSPNCSRNETCNPADGDGGYDSPRPGKCGPAPKAGEACGYNQCVEGFFCNSSYKCEAVKANGATCDYSSECSSFICEKGKCVAERCTTP